MTVDVTNQEKLPMDYARVERVLNFVYANAIRGNPESVLKTIDKFCYDETWCMNVGDVKGPIVKEIIQKHGPKKLVEIGGYYGYSAIMFSNLIKNHPDAHYYTIEFDAVLACVIEKMVNYAGLSHKVTVLTGNLSTTLPTLLTTHQLTTVDFLFIDHLKERYLPDFKIADEANWFKTGTVICADNVITPGAPDYISHLEKHPNFSSELIPTELEYTNGQIKDAIMVSIRN